MAGCNWWGVRPELLYAQVMIETGNLRFGSDVTPWAAECNLRWSWCSRKQWRGLSSDTVLKGLRAQALHLRAYAGYEPRQLIKQRLRDWPSLWFVVLLLREINIIRKLAGARGQWIKLCCRNVSRNEWAVSQKYAAKLTKELREIRLLFSKLCRAEFMRSTWSFRPSAFTAMTSYLSGSPSMELSMSK